VGPYPYYRRTQMKSNRSAVIALVGWAIAILILFWVISLKYEPDGLGGPMWKHPEDSE